MLLALSLFPDADGLDGFIEESMPWLGAWCVILAVVLALMLGAQLVQHFRCRSPVEKLLRRKFG